MAKLTVSSVQKVHTTWASYREARKSYHSTASSSEELHLNLKVTALALFSPRVLHAFHEIHTQS